MSRENSFQLSDKAVITDPSYQIGVWCQAIIDNVRPGTYAAKEEGNHFVALNEDFIGKNVIWGLPEYEIGVDQGYLGVYDLNQFKSGPGSIGSGITVPDGTYFLSLAVAGFEIVGFKIKIK